MINLAIAAQAAYEFVNKDKSKRKLDDIILCEFNRDYDNKNWFNVTTMAGVQLFVSVHKNSVPQGEIYNGTRVTGKGTPYHITEWVGTTV